MDYLSKWPAIQEWDVNAVCARERVHVKQFKER
jgi:hypothetical protein